MEEFLADSLFNGDKEAQIQAAVGIGKLTVKQKHKLAEIGVIPVLISILQYEDCEAIEAALYGLLALASGSERNKVCIVKCGAIQVLLSLLQNWNETIGELCIAAMLVLSSCSRNRIAIASSGSIQALIAIISTEQNGAMSSISLQAKIDAVATLHNLSTSRQIIPLILASGGLSCLIELIITSEKSSLVTEKALALLENIVSSSSNALRETASISSVIPALVETLEEGSPQCQENAVTILLLICRSSRERYRELILREGVMPGLLQVSVDGTCRAKDMAQHLLLLLRDYSKYGSTKHLKHEFIEQIMQEIDSEGEIVVGATLRLVEEMVAKLKT